MKGFSVGGEEGNVNGKTGGQEGGGVETYERQWKAAAKECRERRHINWQGVEERRLTSGPRR